MNFFMRIVLFQSAPRSRERGDCDPANRQGRKALLTHFRERDELFVTVEVLVVKERGKMCSRLGFRAARDINRAGPALWVRGEGVIG